MRMNLSRTSYVNVYRLSFGYVKQVVPNCKVESLHWRISIDIEGYLDLFIGEEEQHSCYGM